MRAPGILVQAPGAGPPQHYCDDHQPGSHKVPGSGTPAQITPIGIAAASPARSTLAAQNGGNMH